MTRFSWILAAGLVLVAGAPAAWAMNHPADAAVPILDDIPYPAVTAAPDSAETGDVLVARAGSLGYRYGVRGVRGGPAGSIVVNPYSGGGGFPDFDGDGKNDFLQDDDGDGIANVQDLDWFLSEHEVKRPEPTAEKSATDTPEETQAD